jgi:hypothetical protein
LNYLHPGDASALTAKLTEAMQTGILLQTSYRICRKDGTTTAIYTPSMKEIGSG